MVEARHRFSVCSSLLQCPMHLGCWPFLDYICLAAQSTYKDFLGAYCLHGLWSSCHLLVLDVCLLELASSAAYLSCSNRDCFLVLECLICCHSQVHKARCFLEDCLMISELSDCSYYVLSEGILAKSSFSLWLSLPRLVSSTVLYLIHHVNFSPYIPVSKILKWDVLDLGMRRLITI